MKLCLCVFYILLVAQFLLQTDVISNPFTILLILITVNALLLSVSFKPIFVDFTLVIDMLTLSSVFIAMVRMLFYYFAHGTKHSEFFQSVSKHYEFFQSVWQTLWIFQSVWETLWIFQSVWFEENPPHYFSPSMTVIFFG